MSDASERSFPVLLFAKCSFIETGCAKPFSLENRNNRPPGRLIPSLRKSIRLPDPSERPETGSPYEEEEGRVTQRGEPVRGGGAVGPELRGGEAKPRPGAGAIARRVVRGLMVLVADDVRRPF